MIAFEGGSRYFFVRSNDELSLLGWLLMSLAQNSGYVLLGISSKTRYLGFGLGGFLAIFRCLKCSLLSQSAKELATNLYWEK